MRKKSQQGFTLIELVVVFTVMAILATIGTTSLVSYNRSQGLSQATNDLVQALNTAKSLSASQLKSLSKNGSSPISCQTYQTLSGYGVQVYAGYYELYVGCKDTGGNHTYSSDDWKTNLPTSVSFDTTTNITDVFFPVLSGGFIADGDSIVLSSLTLDNKKITKTISLTKGYISVSP